MTPQVEETLASYLSPDLASSLKRQILPTNLCSTTSMLMEKAFQAAGQAGAGLHTMAVLQAYQADLNAGSTIDEEAFTELRWATNLSLHTTKQTACSIAVQWHCANQSSCSMAALMSTERHLWLNLTGIKDKDRVFLLDAPVSPSGLFVDSVNTVVSRYWEVKKHEEAFVQFLPCYTQGGWAAGHPALSRSFCKGGSKTQCEKKCGESRSPS